MYFPLCHTGIPCLAVLVVDSTAMSEIQIMLVDADALIESGKMQEAYQLYTKIVETDRDCVDAWMMLGAIHAESGRVDEAMACCKRAIELDSDHVEAYAVLGRILAADGRIDEAIACYEQATRIDPEYDEAWTMLATACLQQGDVDRAEACSRRAIRLLPDQEDGYLGLSQVCIARGQFREATEYAQQAATRGPSSLLAWSILGYANERLQQWKHADAAYSRAIELDPGEANVYIGRGRTRMALDQLEAAEADLKNALSVEVTAADAHFNLGLLADKQGNTSTAEACYRKALELQPEYVEAWLQLGNLLQAPGQNSTAFDCYQQAIRIAPDNPDAHYNLGVLYKRQNDFDEARECFDRAISLRPDFTEAHWDKSFVSLMQGDYATGWKEYEWRFRHEMHVDRPFQQPLWDGSVIPDATILVHDEQGLGDTIQFVRYLPEVRQRCGTVIFECHRGLQELIKRCDGFDRIIQRQSLAVCPDVQFDVHIPLLSLPGVFGTTLESIPWDGPYLHVDELLRKQWQQRLSGDKGFRVGIAWSGSPMHTNEVHRSCPLEEFAVLASVPGVSLYSLQQGADDERSARIASVMGLIRLDKELDRTASFVDTAAVMKVLDLVITIDTSIAHLAGGLGVPVWTLLCAYPDWRWLMARDDTPWYPGMRLFRQQSPGEWGTVMQQVVEVLRDTLAVSGRT